MAYWEKISERGKVEDRRSMVPAAVGGLSITGLALLLLLNVLTGGDVRDIFSQLPSIRIEQQPAYNPESFEGTDSYEVFASTVLGSNNELWSDFFSQVGREYAEPTLVLFRTATTSGCGTATSQVGPHYCPLDETIYLDETFFDELRNRFGARGGDVAEAYVISHEVAHHVQSQLGVLEAVHSGQSNEDSIKLELQADCFAGLWIHSLKGQNIFEPDEIIEAMDAAAAVGDDRIQERVTGYINPESWTHGSSEQRTYWFNRGVESGTVSACDTFET